MANVRYGTSNSGDYWGLFVFWTCHLHVIILFSLPLVTAKINSISRKKVFFFLQKVDNKGEWLGPFLLFYSFDCREKEEKLARPESQNDQKAEITEKPKRPKSGND